MKIRDQVYLISFSSSLVPMIILALVTFFTMEYELKRSEEEKLELMFTGGETYLEVLFEDIDSRLEVLSDIYIDHDADEVQEYMDIFSNRSDAVEYFAFGSSKGGMYVGEGSPDIFPEEYDPRIRPWYKGALERDEYFLSEVFIHAITGEPAVTISKKIEVGSRVEGVMVALINLESLGQTLGGNGTGKIANFFVMNGRGDLVINTGPSDEIFYKFKERFQELEVGELVAVEEEGVRKLYHTHKIPSIDLVLVGGILEDELMAPVVRLQRAILLIIIFTVTLSSILTIIFGKKLSESLTRLTHIIDNIARGNYSKNILKLTEFIDVDSELYLVKEGIEKMQDEIKVREEKLKTISERDPLTKIFNRGAIMDLVEMERERANSFGTEFSLVMFDLDHFKNINDTYGHQFGDEVLQEVTKAASATLKKADILGRYGGEEFLILLPDTELEGGRATAERVRRKIAKLKWKHDVVVTASFGVTKSCRGRRDIVSLITAVDGLLYRAKKNGRNRVEFKREVLD